MAWGDGTRGWDGMMGMAWHEMIGSDTIKPMTLNIIYGVVFRSSTHNMEQSKGPCRIIDFIIKKTPPPYNFEFCAKNCSRPRFPTVGTSVFGEDWGPNMGETFYSVHITWAERKGMGWHDMACDAWAWA